MLYSFTRRQVDAITGMRPPVLTDLLKRNIITASKHRGTGTGDNHVFDVADVFGIAAVQYLRPKAESAGLLRAMFDFWHSEEGRRLATQGEAADGVVVLDATGHVAFEGEKDVTKLAAARKSAVLYIIEPNMLSLDIYSHIAMFRISNEHTEPLPSGREPRKKRVVPVSKPKHEGGAKKRESAKAAKKKPERKK